MRTIYKTEWTYIRRKTSFRSKEWRPPRAADAFRSSLEDRRGHPAAYSHRRHSAPDCLPSQTAASPSCLPYMQSCNTIIMLGTCYSKKKSITKKFQIAGQVKTKIHLLNSSWDNGEAYASIFGTTYCPLLVSRAPFVFGSSTTVTWVAGMPVAFLARWKSMSDWNQEWHYCFKIGNTFSMIFLNLFSIFTFFFKGNLSLSLVKIVHVVTALFGQALMKWPGWLHL